MRILLTGGSGTVGKEVLTLLTQKADFEIIVFDVDTKKSRAVYKNYHDKITVIYGDITQVESVEKACKLIDVVIHLAAIIPPLADENPTLAHEVNVIGTKNIILSLEKFSPKAFLLYSSSVSVYGDRLEDHLIKVTDKIEPSEGDEYGKTKIETERLIQESQLNWTIFRLSAIMGFNNHKVSGLMFHMPLATRMEITTPLDTARAFVNGISHKAALNHNIFNLGGGEKCQLTYEAFLTRNFEITGLGALTFPPKAFAEKNFHCGYYADGNDLEGILHFRKATLESYFLDLKASIPTAQRVMTKLFSPIIKKYLTSLSEPLKAMKEKDEVLINRFFKQ
jgi:nucleoside-diphosphate-sugar epimerase